MHAINQLFTSSKTDAAVLGHYLRVEALRQQVEDLAARLRDRDGPLVVLEARALLRVGHRAERRFADGVAPTVEQLDQNLRPAQVELKKRLPHGAAPKMHRFVIRYASCNVGSFRDQHHEAPNTACTEAGSHRFAGRTEHSSSIAGMSISNIAVCSFLMSEW